MSRAIQIGERLIPADNLIHDLVQYQLLPQFLQEFVIEQALASVTLTPEEASQSLQQFRQNQNLTTPEAETQYCHLYRLTPEQFQQRAMQLGKIEKYKQQTWGHTLEAEFIQTKQLYDRFVYSLIRTHNLDLAQELYFRIREGEADFAVLARQFSQGSEQESGGVIGPAEARTLHPQLVQMLATSPLGLVLPPTRLGEWIVIVRPEKVVPAQWDESMRQRLLHQCWQRWLQAQVQSLTVNLSPAGVL
jgi:parvulin-like peptidyl-prolyl isomerase